MITIMRQSYHIYQNMFAKTNRRAEDPPKVHEQLKIIITAGPALKKWSKQSKNSRQRVHILKEWISTERSYIDDLKIIENSIQKPFKTAKLISPEQDRMLFPNLKAMVDLSVDLTRCIEAALSVWHPHTVVIGQSIKAYSKFFMIYREYCNNFMKGQQVIKDLKTNPETLKIEQKLKLDIESYVIKPVQRPPKYQLLLRQYHKALHKDHKDFNSIAQAIQKYHEVNELNNQSMDKQIRVKAMIKLDRLYGGIISNRSGRQYLKQFTCNNFIGRCQAHAFNDMVIVLKKNNTDTPTLDKRILLDNTSYIRRKIHLKYSKNMVFLCGINTSAHLLFDSPADVSLFIDQIQKIIKNLQEKEEDKRQRFHQNETKKGNMLKFKVSKWSEDLYFKIQYKARMKVTVEGTMKPLGQAFYMTRFRLIYPFKLNQTLTITRQMMEQVQNYLLLKYPTLKIPSVSEGSEQIGFYDKIKNHTQIIEHRSFLYEQFLNFVFRNEEFYSNWKVLSDLLGVNSSFYKFAATQNFVCKCSICIEMKDDLSIKYYIAKNKQMRKHKKIMGSRLMFVKKDESPSTPSYLSQDGRDIILYKSICSNNYFRMMQNIRKCDISQDADYYEKVISLEARMGHIQYSLLEVDENVQPLKEPVCVRVNIVSSEEEFIDIKLREDRYIRSIIEQIGAKNSIQVVYDWGLFLIVDDQMVQMPPDEKILAFADKWKVQITSSEDIDEESSFLVRKLMDLKQFGGQIFGNGRGTLLFKKWFYFEPQLEIQWCRDNKERYGFLINLIYGRFKSQDISLKFGQIVDMCALYMLRKSFEKVKYYYTADNMEFDNLKQIMPQNHWPLFREQGFKVELFTKVKNWYEQLSRVENQRNAIALIYAKTLQALEANKNWMNRNFIVSSYKAEKPNDIKIGINMRRFKVKSRQSNQTMFQLDILSLKYRVTTFSLFIQSNHREYRYDGIQIHDIKNVIQVYKAYRNMVDGNRETNQ